MPGSSPTIDRRELVRRLKSVDLPTLGRPTMARTGHVDVSTAVSRLLTGGAAASSNGLGQLGIDAAHRSLALHRTFAELAFARGRAGFGGGLRRRTALDLGARVLGAVGG